MQVQIVAVGQLEQGQQPQGLGLEHVGGGDRQAAVVLHEARLAQLAAAAGNQAGQAEGALLAALLQLGGEGAGQAAYVAGHQEIAAHEALHRRFVPPPLPAHAPGHLGLEVEGQLLLGPPGGAVQVVAHPPEEIEGLLEGAALAAGEQPLQRLGAQHAVGGQAAGRSRTGR